MFTQFKKLFYFSLLFFFLFLVFFVFNPWPDAWGFLTIQRGEIMHFEAASSKTANLSPSPIPALTLEETLVKVEESLVNNPQDIFDFLSQEIQSTFTPEAWATALQENPVKISSWQVEQITYLTADWAEVRVKLILANKDESSFLIVFHREDGLWRIFGTQPL